MTRNVRRMPMLSASTPPPSGPMAAERICAAWTRPTALPVSSRRDWLVAIASPSGPMPPNKPMPTRSANNWTTFVTAAESSRMTT